jgi:type I site-specific restriction endonuclease
MTDSLVTHFTKPYMDKANEIVDELGVIGDEEYTSAVGESGTVAMHLRERFEGITNQFYAQLDLFAEAVKSNRANIRSTRQDLTVSVNNVAALLTQEFGAITRTDGFMKVVNKADAVELGNEAKRRVSRWREDIYKIIHSWHTLHR